MSLAEGVASSAVAAGPVRLIWKTFYFNALRHEWRDNILIYLTIQLFRFAARLNACCIVPEPSKNSVYRRQYSPHQFVRRRTVGRRYHRNTGRLPNTHAFGTITTR
jgi:hypothetical protein